MKTATPEPDEFPLNTAEFAKLNHVEPATVIKRRCETGEYYGIKARKLANRRLAWPNCQVLA